MTAIPSGADHRLGSSGQSVDDVKANERVRGRPAKVVAVTFNNNPRAVHEQDESEGR